MDFPSRIKQLIDQAHATIVRRNEPASRSGLSADQPVPGPWDKDWVVAELTHSATSPIAYDHDNLWGRERRAVLPFLVDCERRFDQFDVPDVIADIAQYTSGKNRIRQLAICGV